MKHVYPVRHPASLDAAATSSGTAAGGPSSAAEQGEPNEQQAREGLPENSTAAEKPSAVDAVSSPNGAPDRPRR